MDYSKCDSECVCYDLPLSYSTDHHEMLYICIKDIRATFHNSSSTIDKILGKPE